MVAVPDLDVAVAEVADRIGVRPDYGGAHEGLGTHNALLSFGSCYLELIAPDPAQPPPAGPRPFGVDQWLEATLVTFAVHPEPGDSIENVVDTARAAGFDPGDPVAMHRLRPDGVRLDWRLTFPSGVTVVPFVIEWGATPSPTDTAPGGASLTSFDVRVPLGDETTRTRLAALGVDVEIVDAPQLATPALFARFDGPAGSMELPL